MRVAPVILHPLFHWAPSRRRPGIRRSGLRINREPVVSTERCGYLCLSQSASQAWMLSGAAAGERGDDWDLWQVTLDHDDEVHVRPFQGNRIQELRVHNDIPRTRVWFVATRTIPERGRKW